MYLVWTLYGYLLLGVVFGVVFILKGIGSLDEDARGSGVWFRLMVLPGSILLWPVLLVKWFKVSRHEH